MASPSPPHGPSAAEAGGHLHRDSSRERRRDGAPAGSDSGRSFSNSFSSHGHTGGPSFLPPERETNAGGEKENRSNSSHLPSSRSRTSKPSRGRSLSHEPPRPRGRNRKGSVDHGDAYHRGDDRGSLGSHSHRSHSLTSSRQSSYHGRSSSHRRQESRTNSNDMFDDRRWQSSSSSGGSYRRHEGDGRSSRSGHSRSRSSGSGYYPSNSGSYRASSSSRHLSGSHDRSSGRDLSSGRSGGRGRSRSSNADYPDHRSRDYGEGGRGRHSKSGGLPDEDLHRSRSRGPSHYSGGDYGSLDADRRRGIYSDSSISSCKEGGKSQYESVASSHQHSRDEFEQDNKRSASERNVSTADAKEDTNAKQSKNAKKDIPDGFDHFLESSGQPSMPGAPEPAGQLSTPGTPAFRDSPVATPRSQSTATTGSASAQPWPYPSRGRLGKLTQVEPSGGGYPKMVEFPLFRVDGSQSGTHTVEILRVEHDPPIGGIKLGAGDVGKDWGRPGSAVNLPQLCYLLKLSERCPRKVIKDRTIDLIKKRCPTTPMEIDASNPGSFLGTDWDGKLYWLGSRMPEGLNWLYFLLAQAQGDHGIPASSPIFRQADTNRNIFRAMEHFSHHDLHFAFVNNQVKASHSVYHPLDLGAINEEGDVMTGEMLYSNEDSARTRFARWGIDPSALSASLSSTSISALNMIEYHAGRSGFEAKMRSMSDDAKFQFIAQSVAAAYSSRKPDPSKLVEEYGDAALALIKANDPEITSTLDELWALHEESSQNTENQGALSSDEEAKSASAPSRSARDAADEAGDAESEGANDESAVEEMDTLSLCTKLSDGLKASGDRSLIAAETLTLRTIHYAIVNIFNPRTPEHLDLILPLTEHVMKLHGPQSKYSKMLAIRMLRKANQLANMPEFGVGIAWSDIICQIEAKEIELEERPNEPPEVTAALDGLKAAISDIRDGKNVTDTNTRDFLHAGVCINRTMWHLLHLCIWYAIIREKTLYKVFFSLGKVGIERLQSARDLATNVDPSFQLDETTTVLVYIQKILCPGLDSEDHWREAARVLCHLHEYMTECTGGGRKEMVNDDFSKGQWHAMSRDADGGHAKQGQKDYCGGPGTSKQKKRVAAIGFSLLAQKAVENQLNGRGDDDSDSDESDAGSDSVASEMFAKRGGYVRSLLRLSKNMVHENCASIILKTEFFQGDQAAPGDVERLRDVLVTKPRQGDPDMKRVTLPAGKLNLVVESQEQIESLRYLINLLPR